MATILIAEDDFGVRAWLTELLEQAGHRVFVAEDRLKAKTAARFQHFDLVITDISMPHEEGLGLIRALQTQQSQTKIIAISGKDPATLGDAKLLGAHAGTEKACRRKRSTPAGGRLADF